MRIFLTGATGFIGSRIVPELIQAGHQVLGLTRSEAGAHALLAAGAEPHRGDIEDLDSLSRGAALCDGVIHTAFDHNFANFVANCDKDRRVIETLGAAIEGTDRPLLITSGTGIGAAAPGQPADEDHFNPAHANPRIASELAGRELTARGINVQVIRLGQIHDTRRQGLITPFIEVARRTGVSAYAGDGLNRYPATHVSDTARLYRLAVEKNVPGARYHAAAEEGISVRSIAEVLGKRLDLPAKSLSSEEAAAHFGWLAAFISMDMPASSAKTRERLAWVPTGRGLIADLENLELDAA